MTNNKNGLNTVSCGIIRDLLPSYADGLTSDVTRGIIEEHISTCASCREYLGQVLSGTLTNKTANDDFPRSDDAELNFLRKENERNRNNLIISIFTAFGLIAFVSIIFLVAYILNYTIRPDCGNLINKLNDRNHSASSNNGYMIGTGNNSLPEGSDAYGLVNNEYVICEHIDIGRFRYVLYLHYHQYYLATLRSNLFGCFKIQSIARLDGNFNIKIVGTDTLRYLIFFGKNEDFSIKQADVIFSEITYSFDISDKPLVLLQTSIDPSIGENKYRFSEENEYIATPVYRFLDKDGNNITSRYFDLPEKKYTIQADLSDFPECAARWRIDWDTFSQDPDMGDIPLPDVEICASLRFKSYLFYLVRFVPRQDGTGSGNSYWEKYRDKIYYVKMLQRIDGSYTIENSANAKAYPDSISYDIHKIEDIDGLWLIYFSSGRPDWSKSIRFVLKPTGNEYTVPDTATSNMCLGMVKFSNDDQFSDISICEFLP